MYFSNVTFFHTAVVKHVRDVIKPATRYILDKSAVVDAIIGVRSGIVDHINNNSQVFTFSLDKSDYDDIDAVCTKSNNLFDIIGDCGD